MTLKDDVLHRMKLALRGVPSVGAVAIASRRTGVCDPGERGVCFEVYERTWAPDGEGEPRGYSFIFESGRYDGFSPDEVREMLTLTGEICLDVMTYRFKHAGQLATDFDRGRFAAALAPRAKR